MAKINFTQELMMMEVGNERQFPAITYDSVVSTSSRLSFKFGRKYKTRRDDENQCVRVTRIK